MSVSKKKNGKWYAEVYMGMKDGKQIKENSKGFDKKLDAQLAELELKKKALETSHVVFDKESFSNIADTWLANREKTVADSTYRGNKYYYEHYIKDYFKSLLVKDIDALDIVKFMSSLSRLSPSTINKAMNNVSQILDFAISVKYINYNPCIGIRKPQIKKKRQSTWSVDEIKKFLALDDVKKSSCYTALLIQFTTGMRPGEVCGLKWKDLHGNYFVPEFGINQYRNKTELKNEKAHDKVYIDDKLVKYLKRFRSRQKAAYAKNDFEKNVNGKNGVRLTDNSYINCLQPDMRPMDPHYLGEMFTKLCKRNNIDHIRLYDSRHSLGTNMMRDGVNPKKVSEIMRHGSVKTTLDIYSHVDDEMKQEEMARYSAKIM